MTQMNAALKASMLPRSRFIDSRGDLDVAGLCDAVGLSESAAARALGKPRQTIAHYFAKRGEFLRLRDSDTRNFFEKLHYAYTLLIGAAGEERVSPDVRDKEIREWFASPNRALRAERPIDLIGRGQIDPLIKALMDVLTAAHGG